MHEFGLVKRIIDIVADEANKHNASKITELSLKVGEASGVSLHSLNFSFDIAKKGTIMEEAELIIETVAPVGFCRICNKRFDTNGYELTCPSCGGTQTDLVAGNEFMIKNISFI